MRQTTEGNPPHDHFAAIGFYLLQFQLKPMQSNITRKWNGPVRLQSCHCVKGAVPKSWAMS